MATASTSREQLAQDVSGLRALLEKTRGEIVSEMARMDKLVSELVDERVEQRVAAQVNKRMTEHCAAVDAKLDAIGSGVSVVPVGLCVFVRVAL